MTNPNDADYDQTHITPSPVMARAMRASQTQAALRVTAFDDSDRILGIPLNLKPNTSRQIVILSQPALHRVHPLAVEWVLGKDGRQSFMKTNYARCLAKGINAVGDFVTTDVACPACIAIGVREPQLLMTFLVDDFENPYTPKATPKNLKPTMIAHPVRVWLIKTAAMINQLNDQAVTRTAGGDLQWCVAKVTRSNSATSPGSGDSVTVVTKFDPEKLRSKAFWPAVAEGIKQRDMSQLFNTTSQDMIHALRLHKQLVDRYDPKTQYDTEGMERVLHGGFTTDPATGRAPATFVDSLRDAVARQAPAQPTSLAPAFEDVVETETPSVGAKPPAGSVIPDDDDDLSALWGDNK